MAIDPNAEIPQFTGYMDDPETWPENLPEGVTKDPAVWYARRITFGDGRTVWEFRQRNSGGGSDGKGDKIFATVPGIPVKSVKDAYEKEQEKAQDDSKPPGGLPTRTVNGQVFQWNPQTRAYDIPTGQAPTAAPSTAQHQEWRPEGTPDGNGGYDNNKLTMAEYINGKRTGVTRAPDDKELRSWNNAREMSRNPGGKTDAEMATERGGKPTGNTRQTTKNGTTVKETEYQLPDGSTVWRSQTETAAPDLVGKPTGNTRQRVENGQTIKETEYVLPDGTKEWRSQTAPEDTKGGFPAEPADAPALNLTPGQVAQGLQKYSAYLAAQVKLHRDSGGKQGISPQDASKLMENRIALAEAAGKESDNLARQQQGVFGSQITQRGQTLQDTGSRRGDANAAYQNNLARFVPNMTMMGPGSAPLIAASLRGSLAANQAYVDQWGGLRESPEISTPGFLQQIRDTSMQGIQTAATGGPVLTGPTGMTPPSAAAPASPPPALPDAATAEAARQQQAAAGGAAEPAPSAPAPAPAVNPVNAAPITVPQPPQGASATADPTQGGGPTFLPRPAFRPDAMTDPVSTPMAPASTAPPMPIPPPDAGGQYAPQMSSVPPGTTGDGSSVWQPPVPTPVDQPGDPGAGYNPSNASQTGPFDPYTGLPRVQRMGPSFLTQARYGQAYDPRQRAAMLGIRPDILELALAG